MNIFFLQGSSDCAISRRRIEAQKVFLCLHFSPLRITKRIAQLGTTNNSFSLASFCNCVFFYKADSADFGIYVFLMSAMTSRAFVGLNDVWKKSPSHVNYKLDLRINDSGNDFLFFFPMPLAFLCTSSDSRILVTQKSITAGTIWGFTTKSCVKFGWYSTVIASGTIPLIFRLWMSSKWSCGAHWSGPPQYNITTGHWIPIIRRAESFDVY